MKRLYHILAVIFTFLPLTAQRLSEKYNAQRPVVVVCDWDKPPYEFLDDKGNPAGTNIDVLQAVMKELDLPVKFVMKEWSIALKTFERGDADIILANARRYRHAPYIVSQNIVNYNRIRVAMHTDSMGMISLKQLEREGAVFKPGDYSAFYFRDNDSLNIRRMEFQTPKVALMGLINGDYKYYIWGEEPLKWKIKELNLEGIVLNEVEIPISKLHFVGRDRKLIESIDDQYSRLKQSGEIAILQDKWLHPEHLQDKSTPIALYIGIVTILLAAVIYLFIHVTKAHARKATRNSTELNKMMYKALHMGNFKVMEYDIRHDRMTNNYGHILPNEGLSLEEFTKRIHPDQQQEFTIKMHRLLDGRERRFELNKQWNAGTAEEPEWLNFHGHVISELDSDGRPAYVINAIHDVTQEAEEDKAARDLVKRYERLANMPFIAMSFYDHGGWLIDLNDAMKKICGISDDNPESKRFWETMCMFDVPLFRSAYSPENRDDLFMCQHMNYPEFGIDKYIEVGVRPLFNAEGDIANYFISTLDITGDRTRDHIRHMYDREINLTNAEIEKKKEQLRFLLVNANRHLWRSDIEQQMIYFYCHSGKPEITMDFETYLSYLAEEDRQRMRQALNNRQATDNDTHGGIYRFTHAADNPNESWFNIYGKPIRNKEGLVTGHVGVGIDMTQHILAKHRLEEETQRANDSLRLKSGFMASMTHELRTPLNAIVGFTGVLEALGDIPERAEYVRIIRNSSDMLQRLINDITEASTITNGAFTIQPTDVDFADAFNDICITLEQRVQTPAVEFLKENPYDSFLTTLDVGRIQQVLTNFVTNAVKFTKQGHIKVGYRYEEMQVGESASNTKYGLYFYCEDTGAGIPKDKQKIVFDRFVKLDEFVQGTGMGLAICKSIAEGFGGKIGVESEGEGKGTTFWIWIPCERKSVY